MGETTTDAPEESRTFYNTRIFSKLTTRLTKVRSIKNITFDLQIIAKDGENS